MAVKDGIELGALLIMIGGLVGVLIERIKTKKGIGIRAIQLLVVIFVFPVILILGLEGILKAELVGTLLGTTLGYALSSIGKEETLKRGRDRENQQPAAQQTTQREPKHEK